MAQNYIEYQFTVVPKEPWEEILLAALQELPFESFDHSETSLLAYVPEMLHFEGFLNSISIFEDIDLISNCGRLNAVSLSHKQDVFKKPSYRFWSISVIPAKAGIYITFNFTFPQRRKPNTTDIQATT